MKVAVIIFLANHLPWSACCAFMADYYVFLNRKYIKPAHVYFSYRSLRENIDVSNVVVEIPALLIMGGKDYTLEFSGMEEYLNETKT
ncbi:hypothetical protein Scep_016322 [Stephania cephalantha]|uniref:Uncharacterized protein n=1 Tax=Stephania cephalantha TaxID=152367 RepID=A0AAP0IME6_9MAGN